MAEYKRRKQAEGLEPDASDGHRISDRESLRHLDNLKGPERTLPESFRAEASRRLGGFDMDRVKVFEDAGLEQLGQKAYARGDEIHVAAGQFAPQSESGRSLLLHEAAHLAQQSAGQTQGLEAGARQVAAGGAFAGAGGPVHVSAAPAQGILGWGAWKKRWKAKREERKDRRYHKKSMEVIRKAIKKKELEDMTPEQRNTEDYNEMKGILHQIGF